MLRFARKLCTIFLGDGLPLSIGMSYKPTVTAPKNETAFTVPWTGTTAPSKILVIRMQAFGDVVITLPYMQALHTVMPTTQFHFLSREEFSSIPENMTMFHHVYTL